MLLEDEGKPQIFSNLFEILETFLIKRTSNQLFDLKIAKELMKYDVFLQINENNIGDDLNQKYIRLLGTSLEFRISNEVIQKVKELLKIDILSNILDKWPARLKLDGKVVFLKLYCCIYIDYKSNLIDNRDFYYQENESGYNEVNDNFEVLIRELSKILCENNEKIKKGFDETGLDVYEASLKPYESSLKEPESEEKILCFLKVALEGVRKLMLFMLRLNDEKIENFMANLLKIKELNGVFLKNLKYLLKLFQKQQEESVLKLKIKEIREKYELEVENIDIIFLSKRNKRTIRVLSLSTFMIVSFLLEDNTIDFLELNHFFNQDQSYINTTATSFQNIGIGCEEYQFFDRKNKIKNKDSIYKKSDLLRKKLKSLYLKEKRDLASGSNLIITEFSNKTQENQFLIRNFCDFTIAYMLTPLQSRAIAIETFLNISEASNGLIPQNMSLHIENQLNLDISIAFNEILHYVKYKTIITQKPYWDSYKKVLLFLKFYRVLSKSNTAFKQQLNQSFPKKEGPFPWVNSFGQLLSLCNIKKGFDSIDSFEPQNRAHLLRIIHYFFVFFAELADGSEELRQRLYLHLSELYKGLIENDNRSLEIFTIKKTLMCFFLKTIQGNHIEIVNFHATSFEIMALYKVLLRTLKEFFEGIIGKKNCVTYERLMREYKTNKVFSDSDLLRFCAYIFIYFKCLAEVKTRYELFFKEREDGLRNKKGCETEELHIFRFFNEIIQKLEISENIRTVYYIIQPESYYLNEETNLFLSKTIKREEFYVKNQLYELETDFNYKRKKKTSLNFQRNIWGSYLLSFMMNILMIFNRNWGFFIGLIELLISFRALNAFFNGKFQILKLFYKEKTILNSLFNQNEVIFAVHVVCLIGGWFFWEILWFFDFLSVFIMILKDNTRKTNKIENISWGFLVNFLGLMICLIIYMNFSRNDLDFGLIVKIAKFWGGFFFLFYFLVPMIVEVWKKQFTKFEGKKPVIIIITNIIKIIIMINNSNKNII